MMNTLVTLASSNMQGIEAGSIFEGKGLLGGKGEELVHDVNVAPLSRNEQSRLPQLVHLIDNGGPNLLKLGIKIGPAYGSHHLGIDLSENVANGKDVGALGCEVELGVMVAAGNLLDVLLLVVALAGIGVGDKGFAGVGEEEGLAGGGEEESGTRGGGVGGRV